MKPYLAVMGVCGWIFFIAALAERPNYHRCYECKRMFLESDFQEVVRDESSPTPKHEYIYFCPNHRKAYDSIQVVDSGYNIVTHYFKKVPDTIEVKENGEPIK